MFGTDASVPLSENVQLRYSDSRLPALFSYLGSCVTSCDPRAMSIVLPRIILRPFGVSPGGRYRRRRRARRASSVEVTNGREAGSSKKPAAAGLEVLYDDGFGAVAMKDYFDAVRVMAAEDDGGPPRWFCPVECARPKVDRAPLLLFLPGTDGVGMELILHHRSLGRVFEVCCFHIPVNDRTPFEGLLQIVEDNVKYENALSPNRPIYIVGDSFGGCLAISVAARNPKNDLVLVLVNPGNIACFGNGAKQHSSYTSSPSQIFDW
uniref:Uncharacterized protein n=1 Tax=Avena sativa TaxID=4498 RepID=A0ACD5UJJ4_AVESA